MGAWEDWDNLDKPRGTGTLLDWFTKLNKEVMKNTIMEGIEMEVGMTVQQLEREWRLEKAGRCKRKLEDITRGDGKRKEEEARKTALSWSVDC